MIFLPRSHLTIYILRVLLLIASFKMMISCGSLNYRVNIDGRDDQEPKARANENSENPQTVKKKVFGIHSPNGWAQKPVKVWFGGNLKSHQKQTLKDAATIWSAAVGHTLFDYAGSHDITGDHFQGLNHSLGDYLNGVYIDYQWAKTERPKGTLATTIWYNSKNGQGIDTGDVRLNGEEYEFANTDLPIDGDKVVVDSLTLFLHEMGHLLGLSHIPEEIDPNSVMNPTIFIGPGLHNRALSKGDMIRIRKIYGCTKDICT